MPVLEKNPVWLEAQGEGKGVPCSKYLSVKIKICDQILKTGI